MEALGFAFEMWHSPGDFISGKISEIGDCTAYLSGLGGFISIRSESVQGIIDRVTIDFDLGQSKKVSQFLEMFKSAAYRIESGDSPAARG
jgi:hypothetical protein